MYKPLSAAALRSEIDSENARRTSQTIALVAAGVGVVTLISRWHYKSRHKKEMQRKRREEILRLKKEGSRDSTTEPARLPDRVRAGSVLANSKLGEEDSELPIAVRRLRTLEEREAPHIEKGEPAPFPQTLPVDSLASRGSSMSSVATSVPHAAVPRKTATPLFNTLLSVYRELREENALAQEEGAQLDSVSSRQGGTRSRAASRLASGPGPFPTSSPSSVSPQSSSSSSGSGSEREDSRRSRRSSVLRASSHAAQAPGPVDARNHPMHSHTHAGHRASSHSPPPRPAAVPFAQRRASAIEPSTTAQAAAQLRTRYALQVMLERERDPKLPHICICPPEIVD